jgi:hypothetical protein
MNRIYPYFFLLLASIATTAIAAGTIITSMSAVSRGSQIEITWQTGDETGIHIFQIERRSEDETKFSPIGKQDARGQSSSYKFTDNSAFYRSQAGKRFTYRIRAIGNGVDQYGPTYTVSHEIASVKRSWGMIKELFR